MKKPQRRAFKLAVGLLVLFILLGITISFLFASNKKIIHALAIAQINKQIKGDVHIGDIRSSFWNTFPTFSICLSDITIRDSLWNQHHHDFLKAGNIYISFHLWSLLRGKPQVQKVFADHALVYLYTDACGNCNLNRHEDVTFNKGDGPIPAFTFRRSRLIIENENLNSYHDIEAIRLDARVAKQGQDLQLKISIKSLVHGVGFNLEKGSYLKEKTLEGDFSLAYHPGDSIALKDVRLKIQHHPVMLNGAIYLHADTMSYDLHVQTSSILYKDAVSLLTQSVQDHMQSIRIEQPFDVDATITGKMARKVVPVITTHFVVRDATMETSLGQFTHCTYTGSYTNHLDSIRPPGDANTKFTFKGFQADWSGLTLTSSQLEIINLQDPFLRCDLQSTFKLHDLNALAGSSTIQFNNGTGQLDITFAGPITEQDTINPVLNGTLILADAELKYLPRNLVFRNCKAILEFNQEDLVIRDVAATAGKTDLHMHGQITNLFSMLNLNPERLTIQWTITSPSLYLNDFLSYVAESAYVLPEKSENKNKLLKTTSNLDRMMRNANVLLNLSAETMAYKKFIATDVNASLQLIGKKIIMKHVQLHHANGMLQVQGTLTNGYNANALDITSTIENADIPGLFRAFDNFGQDAITADNMKGKLSGKIIMKGTLTDKALVQENSMKGSIDFTILDGELNDFDPLVNIASTSLKNRDFSRIKFAELSNRLDIDGSAIWIHKMEIRSNVAVLFVEGVYDTKKGTDMSIQIPLSNLSKAENEMMENTGRAGMNVRLRAKTGNDGNLKISWDPLNHASRKRKAEMQKDTIQ